MKKLLAILLAASMVFAFAACGGNNEEETTTTAPAEEITEAIDENVTDAPVADDATDAAPTEDAGADASAVDASEAESTVPAEPTTGLSKAEFVALINAETAKIAKSGSYNFNRECKYTDPIDVGGATGTLNSIISGIDENSNLDTVVGGFLGIGTKTGAYPKDKLKEDYRIKATSLKESDLGSFSEANGVYTFTLANATNPKKTNATPLSRMTNDFITHEEVVKGVADFTGAIKVENTTVNYDNIKVSVTVVGGKITDIQYSYAFDAALTLKVLFTINGTGAATTKGVYSDIKY